MISGYFNMVLNNNLILSMFVALIVTLIYFIDNKKQSKDIEFKSYLKLFVYVSSCVYLAFYLKNNKITENVSNYSKINIGEPDF